MVTLKNFVSESAEAECPPEDTYTWELTDIGEFEEKDSRGFRESDPDVINTQSRFVWTLVDFDYDEEQDERDWNGFEARTYVTFYRRLQSEREDPTKNKAIFKSERSVAYQVLTALGFDVDSGEDIDLGTAKGTRVKASCAPKESGWPKLEKFSKTRQKRVRRADSDDEPEDAAARPNPFKRDPNAA